MHKAILKTKIGMMKFVCFPFLLFVLLFSGCGEKDADAGSNAFAELVKSYEAHEGYDKEEWPLGVSTKEYYENEAKFAKEKLAEISDLQVENLSETDKISISLLQFVLQDKIDFYVEQA